MKRTIFLVLAALPFFVTGCASNPPSAAVVQKEASMPAPVLETKKEIIFPSPTGAVAALIKNGDVKHAKMEAAAHLVSAMKKECSWEKPLNYYAGRVIIETQVSRVENTVRVRARMDSSLCPEKQ